MKDTAILEPFFVKPMARFGVRELGRLTRVDTKTVMKYLRASTRSNIIVRRQEKGKYPYYEANRSSLAFRHAKSEILVSKMIESGLIEYLQSTLNPKVIVLFGSVQKGTYHSESDIDLFIQADYSQVDLRKYNLKLGHQIHLLFDKDLKSLNHGLLENIYNGLVLAGILEVP